MRSIRRRLLAWILGALSAGSLALVGVSYLVTLEEMDEIFDENLKQVALAVASHHRFDGGPTPQRREAMPQLPRVYEEEGNFDFVTLTWTREGRLTFVSEPDVALPFSATSGLTSAEVGGETWHLYTIVLDGGVVQVAQRASSRRTLAAEAASKLFLPLFVLIVLIGALLTVALRRGLKPLDEAADGVAARSAVSLEPIAQAGLPQEIHPLIRSINGLMHRLAEAFSAQRRFVADAAHELRSPVTALRLQLQLLERAKDEPAREHAVAQLKAGIERSQRLIEQLLSLSRVEPDGPAQAPQRLDLGELVRDVVGRHSAAAEHKGVDLGADARDAIAVTGDRQQLEVLLDNLIGNAIRYTPAGGTVDVRAARIDGRPALQVVDNGPGISEVERERVFDRFYRGEGVQSDEQLSGSGLGLAIVQAIAQRHGAAVGLHTAASGQGLEVRVVFTA
jgi:signal transduction histidine kinase